ncbi:MAG: hypothetical protein C0469_00460 [Cyanobacteria bacterium DS2.3.42]|nr:hypothetical protein [Cyanobacteria bacterium DS2.3.42]
MRKLKKEAALSASSTQTGIEQLLLPIKETLATAPVDNLLARPEMHMFLRPYFLLDKHADKTIGFETREVVLVNGKEIERRWCVKPDLEYGMPGSVERDVLLVLYEIAYERYISKKLPVPEIMTVGSIRSILKRLGLRPCGQTAAAVKLALKRLVHTTCKSENSWFDKSKNLFLTEAFQLLRGVGIAGESDGNGGVVEETFVIFDDRIRSNLNARYLMIINLHLLRALDSDIAKHLYPLLSHWLWRSNQLGCWRVEYRWLAQHIGIKVFDTVWRAKKQLKSANDELIRRGLISRCDWDAFTLYYFPGPTFEEEQSRRSAAKVNAREQTIPIPHVQIPKDDHDLLLPVLNLYASGVPMADALLKTRGITHQQAEALCLEKGIQLTFKK